MKKTVSFLFLATFAQVGFSSDYSNTPATGSKGEWKWSKNLAIRDFGTGIILGIAFNPHKQCHEANFAIVGNAEIDSITISIDRNKIKSAVPSTLGPYNGKPSVGFQLSDSVLRELKNGASLTVETDKGALNTSLSGIAYSMNMAYSNCMMTAGKTTLQPSRSVARKAPQRRQQPQQQPVSKQNSQACKQARATYDTCQRSLYSNAVLAQGAGPMGRQGKAGLVSLNGCKVATRIYMKSCGY